MKKKAKPHHQELEVKIDADEVDVAGFKAWCFARNPSQYRRLTSPDVYYTQGANVVRHRAGGDTAGELTVKRRTSRSSTRSRLEIDLRFSPKTTPDDVQSFLAATGWTPAFTVIKDCHIFWFADQKPGVEVVLYTVRCVYSDGTQTEPRRFVEIEIHKSDSHHVRALSVLKDWEKDTRKQFNLGPTQSESLYEIYSGKRYKMVKSKSRTPTATKSH